MEVQKGSSEAPNTRRISELSTMSKMLGIDRENRRRLQRFVGLYAVENATYVDEVSREAPKIRKSRKGI